jgi:hypothetical protein
MSFGWKLPQPPNGVVGVAVDGHERAGGAVLRRGHLVRRHEGRDVPNYVVTPPATGWR